MQFIFNIDNILRRDKIQNILHKRESKWRDDRLKEQQNLRDFIEIVDCIETIYLNDKRKDINCTSEKWFTIKTTTVKSVVFLREQLYSCKVMAHCHIS